jgi:hypothetical protein
VIFRKRTTAIALILFFSCCSISWAHHPSGGSGTGQAGPVTTISASTLQKGKWVFELQTEYVMFDTFSDTKLLGFAEAGNDVHTFDSLFHAFASISYGIKDNLTLSLNLPYVLINNIREVHQDAPDEIHHLGDSQGIGDMTILGYYRFVKRTDIHFESSLLLGMKVPTGNTHKKDVHGERFETEHQPGSGSWDPMIGLAATKRLGSLSMDANMLYIVATKGAQDTDLGDSLNYNAAISYRVPLRKRIFCDLIIEANGEWKQDQKINGAKDKDKNSGGTTVFLSPGLRVSINDRWTAYLSIGVPVIQDLNGIQTDTSVRTITGISIGF